MFVLLFNFGGDGEVVVVLLFVGCREPIGAQWSVTVVAAARLLIDTENFDGSVCKEAGRT